MRLGAQFYSINDKTKTPEGVYESFKEMKSIGYSIVQMSAICPIAPEKLREFSLEFDLPIACTHIDPTFILEETDKIINEHRIYNCPVIGIGSMPEKYRGSLDGIRKFIKDFSVPAKKIKDAGLKFAYHNHAFEFDDLGGIIAYDMLIEEFPDLDFILDTYWVKFGGYDYLKYIKTIGRDRMQNVHFKDMKEAPKGEIVPCGEGVIDFKPIIALCDELDIENALVEQDNAPKSGDSYGQMRISYNNIKNFFGGN